MNGTWPTLEEVITKLIDDRVSSTQSEVDEYVNAAVKGLKLVTQQGLIDAVDALRGAIVEQATKKAVDAVRRALMDALVDLEGK